MPDKTPLIKKPAKKKVAVKKSAAKKAAPTQRNNVKSADKRAYLSRQERRIQLLNCARRLVEGGSWESLSMTSLAQEAGASRQLVYQHFDSLEDLIEATIFDMFRGFYTHLLDGVKNPNASAWDVLDLITDNVLALPRGRAIAYLQVISTPYVKGQPLAEAAKRLRQISILPGHRALEELHIDKPGADIEVIARMMESAIWSGHVLISDGTATVDEVKSNIQWLYRSMLGGGVTTKQGARQGSKRSPR